VIKVDSHTVLSIIRLLLFTVFQEHPVASRNFTWLRFFLVPFLTKLNHDLLFNECRSRHHTIATTKSHNTIMVSPHINNVTLSPDSNDDSSSGEVLRSSLVLQVAEKQKRLSVSSIKSTKTCLATNTGDKANKADTSMRVLFKQPTRWQSEDLNADICPTMPLRQRSNGTITLFEAKFQALEAVTIARANDELSSTQHSLASSAA
jgi:hypothetical protein